MIKLKKILTWQRRHRIEAFTLSLVLILACLGMDCVSIFASNYKENKELLNGNAIYAPNFTTSLSGVPGTIEQVYSNADSTKCAILVHFDDMSKLSVNAEDYQMFVRSFDISTGRGALRKVLDMTGGYCIFGGSGRALLYLSSSQGFGSHPLECIVRSNRTVYTAGSDTQEMQQQKEQDSTFATYDQYRIIINPHARDVSKVDFLDDLDTQALYKQAIVDNAEADMRESLKGSIAAMQVSYNALTAYRDNLEGLDVKVPTLPDEIAGDSFTEEETAEGTMLVYQPGYVYAGGVDFDWFHNNLTSGSFLEGVTGSQTPGQFFSVLSAQTVIDSETLQELNTSGWSKRDGTAISDNSDDENSATIRNNINGYVTAVRDYCNKKKKYQREELVNYLKLEYNMENAGENMSGSFRDGIVTTW